MILCGSVVSVSMYPFLFLILFESSFYFLSPANDLSIMFIFSKKQFFVFLLFYIFASDLFSSALISIIYFLLLIWDLVCSAFSGVSRYIVRFFLFEILLLFWHRHLLLLTSLLLLLFCIPWVLAYCVSIFIYFK